MKVSVQNRNNTMATVNKNQRKHLSLPAVSAACIAAISLPRNFE